MPVLRELILRPDTPLDADVKTMIAAQLDTAKSRLPRSGTDQATAAGCSYRELHSRRMRALTVARRHRFRAAELSPPFARRQPRTFPPEYSDLDVEIEPGDRTRQRPKTVERTVGCAVFLYLAAYAENLLFCRCGRG